MNTIVIGVLFLAAVREDPAYCVRSQNRESGRSRTRRSGIILHGEPAVLAWLAAHVEFDYNRMSDAPHNALKSCDGVSQRPPEE